MIALLALAFGLTAFTYSLAGFAGGSTYLALLVLFAVPKTVAPALVLMCNILVSALGSARFVNAGLLRPRLLVPHMALAIPAAYIGGRMEISTLQFQLLTAFALLWASVYLITQHRKHDEALVTKPPPLAIAIPAGGVLGLLSGLIGIGGGIFLAPLLYALKAGTPKEIASTCSLFILVNSLAGLVGQLQKSGFSGELVAYWPLPLAVLAGGWTGSHLTLKVLSLRHIALATGVILFCIAARLWVTLLA
jgi:uncharacterized membrane protein YfcA